MCHERLVDYELRALVSFEIIVPLRPNLELFLWAVEVLCLYFVSKVFVSTEAHADYNAVDYIQAASCFICFNTMSSFLKPTLLILRNPKKFVNKDRSLHYI